MIDAKELFEKHAGEHCRFSRIEKPLHARPDICAFLLLDKIAPKPGADMVSGTAHEEIFLNADMELFALRATEDEVITLRRCGVRYHADFDCFAMYV